MATRRTSTQILLLSILLLTKSNFLEAAESNTDSRNVVCIERERKALLELRKGLKHPSGWLSSWVGKDCCNWTGINCSDTTGNVLKLDLKTIDVSSSFGQSEALNNRTCLGGMLNPSLLNLKYLSYLDMSGNNFQGIPIPEFIGSLKNLRYLDLSEASFNGEVGLSSLLYLDLGAMNLSKANNWFEAVNMLLSLTTLYLSSCELNGLPESLTVPYARFQIGSVYNLRTLDLSSNVINGEIKGFIDALGGCSNNTLADLDLSSDNLQGNLPDSLGKLKYLRIITENHFWNLSRLYRFASSSISKSVIFNLSRDWVPSYSLSEITVSNCQLGPGFPTWLRTQVELSQLTLSVAGISDMIPVWLSFG
ncbi:hypothetical protein Goshw_025936 [Gossypium schwendimanii]|uniref:Leucine-rich repeat-containing N-terminal plant-type domain-containing protein n=1 Tax=Gossypium schwendimanii TaxID=34291 RepID=A0A7J9LCH4_GOSSC|nr:hypothetical protein [Gossypium schwendimanii]